MGSLIRSMDWSKTSLGPVAGWPQSLRTTVSICLASDLPICVIWGPGLVQLYNDAYRVICGDKHPQSMGQNFHECWKDAWPVFGEAHNSALAGDKAFLEVKQIFLERHGYVEEGFFTFSFSPIRDEAGRIGGLFHPVIEMTTQMLSERRTRALRDLAFQTSKAKSVSEALSLCAQTLAQYDLDLPFTLLYALDPSGDQARLIGSTGLNKETVASLSTVIFRPGKQTLWPLEEVIRSGAAVHIDDVRQRIGSASVGPYPEPPNTALALPIIPPGADRPAAIFIAGVSSRLPMNEAYRGFYDLLASSVTTAVANARAYEDGRRRVEALAEPDRAKTRPLVLVVDDNADMRQYIVGLLGQHYCTEAVPDGEAALAAALERTPDLVLTDVMMPRPGGFGLLQALRADPRTSGVPVILLSARAGEESRIKGMEQGADDYLVKPFCARELLTRVTAHLKMALMRREFSEALRASEQHHRLLFEQMADGIVVADATGRYVDVNAAACKILGYSRDELLARTITDVLEPDEWPRIAPEIARCADGQVMHSEWRFRRKDGSVFVGEITGSQLQDGRVQGILRDITERRATEAAIRASEVRVRTILESITDGFFSLDRDWRISYINTAGERFLDRTPGDLIGKVLWDEFPGTVGSEFERVYRRVVASRVRESFTAYDPNFDSWYEVTVYPAPEGLSVYFRDVTQQKLSEALLRTSEERRRLALDAAELGTWNFDPASGVVQTDARFRAIFGTTEECPDSLQLFAIIHPDDVSAVQEAMAAATRLEDPAPSAIEYRVVHPDGSQRWVSGKGRSSFEGAGPTRRAVSFDGTIADITDRKRSEDALKASENRSRIILDSITDGFFAIDSDWRFTYMNAAGERSMEFTPGYLIGKCFWDEYPGMVGSEFERFYRRVAASRVSESFAAHYPELDRWYEVTAYPAPNGLSVYFRDVTNRRRLEQERQQFAALVEASPDFIGVAGLDQRGVYVNRAGQEMSGLEHGQVASISVLDFFPESERDRIFGLIADSKSGGHVVVDTWFQHLKTGQLIPVSWSYLRLRDTSGNVSGYATVTRDLTERYNAENLLRASEEKRRLALDAAELGMWHVEPVTRATSTDARYRAIFGTTEEWTDYLQAVAVIHPDDQPAVLEAVAAATRLENPTQFTLEYRIVHPDGSLRWILANGRASFEEIGSARRVTSFDGTVADITDRKRGEEERERLVARLQEQDQRKNEFLATLAHELRNPLAPIRNGLQVMRLASGSADATERVRSMMERQVGQMVHLIDDLLDLSRISRGKIDLRKERIELAGAIAQSIETSRPFIDQAGHELLIEVPPRPIYVDADLTRLTQVFSNLLNNAAKFTDRGGRIRLTMKQLGAEAIISVQDNGVGIPTPMLARVFEMFTQVDGNQDRSKGGLGIGLSIVQRLIEMHGGAVEVRSDGHGRGSEFVVRLPLAFSLAEDRPTDQPEPVHPTSHHRILVVDDNVDAAESLAMMLTMMGNETVTAHDGLEALDVAAAFTPEVMFVDIGMPKLNGYEVGRRIRQQAWGKDMVLVALTGLGQEEDKRRSREAGFDFHVTKPMLPTALEKLLAGVTAARGAVDSDTQ